MTRRVVARKPHTDRRRVVNKPRRVVHDLANRVAKFDLSDCGVIRMLCRVFKV